MFLTILGFTAAICTTVSFLPQVIKTWKTKKTKDLSLPMYLILETGAILWFTYGLFLKDPAIFVTNGVIFFLALSLIFLKIKHG